MFPRVKTLAVMNMWSLVQRERSGLGVDGQNERGGHLAGWPAPSTFTQLYSWVIGSTLGNEFLFHFFRQAFRARLTND